MANVNDLIDQRRFDLSSVRKVLDDLTYPELVATLQAPETITVYAKGHGHWREGDGHPPLADDDPAVMSAIARCALNRARLATTGISFSQFHQQRCGWCEYPIALLLAALDWSIWTSRLVTMEWFVWRQGMHVPERLVTYTRVSERTGTYENPAYERFHRLTIHEQRELVERIQSESRSMLDGTEREHDPWCRYEPDHGGECSDRPE